MDLFYPVFFFFPFFTETHSSTGRPGGRWFDPRLGQCSFRGLMIVIWNRIHSSLTALHLFRQWSCGKAMVWKEYYAEFRLKELQEGTDRCAGRLIFGTDNE